MPSNENTPHPNSLAKQRASLLAELREVVFVSGQWEAVSAWVQLPVSPKILSSNFLVIIKAALFLMR